MTQQPPGQRPTHGQEGRHDLGQGDSQVSKPRNPGDRLSQLGVVVALSVAVVVLVITGLVVVLIVADDDRVADASKNLAPPASAPISSPPVTATSTGGSANTWSVKKIIKLGNHPILRDPDAGLPNLACELPQWANDPSAAKAFFRAASRCLDVAWGPFIRSHDLPFTPPRLYFPTGETFDSDCGTINVGIETASYYCEGELFLPFQGLQVEQYGDKPGVYLALIAHEYGHHVQELTGIMDAAWQRIYAAGETSAKGLEMSRRKELQAQCFSGMFLGAHVDRGGSITRQMYQEAWEDQPTRGDDTSGSQDHGTNANYAKWWRDGAMDNRMVLCNTFTAPRAEVR